MSDLPPESKALRRELLFGILAFILGFFASLVGFAWLLNRFGAIKQRWWDILHLGINLVIVSFLIGLGLCAGTVILLSWIHHRRGIYRCLFCGRQLKRAGIPCDCRKDNL
jgi:hypothetical protein